MRVRFKRENTVRLSQELDQLLNRLDNINKP
ncbi:Spo0E family sporulation regulatory protein-aspartic acid phosphatase [Terribacillus saccharophilus]